MPDGPEYVATVVIGAVGPGLKPRSTPPMIRVKPSSWVTVKVCPFVTVTNPVNWISVPVIPSDIRDVRAPGVFSVMLKAPPLFRKVWIGCH